MPKIDLSKFSFSYRSNFNDKKGFFTFLQEMMIAQNDWQTQNKKNIGILRIPIGGDKARCQKMVENILANRSTFYYQMSTYIEKQKIDFAKFQYLKIEYKGLVSEEWQAFDNCLMDFIDYMLPALITEMGNEFAVEHIVYADHIFPKKGNISFEILFQSVEPYILYGLLQVYLDYMDRHDMLTYERYTDPPRKQKQNQEETEKKGETETNAV